MTVLGGVTEKKGEIKNTVLVGIRKDNISRQLINWALVKVAEPGDIVVAVHVCRDLDVNSKENSSMDDYLEVYKGLCHVKQVTLTGKNIRGSSARRALVREAKHCNASALVVGINWQNHLRGWFSMAKYCAHGLPKTIAVLAIDNGKLIFERGSSTNQLQGFTGDPRPSLSIVQNADNVPEINSRDSNTDDSNLELNFSVQSHKQQSRNSSRDSRVDVLSIGSSNSMSQLMREQTDAKPGWPLLQKTVSMSPDSPKDSEARKMSVVQWVMSLPDRSSPPTPQAQMGDDMDQTQNSFERDINNHGRKRYNKSFSMSEELQRELEILLKTNSSSCRWFSHQELMTATSQFSSGNLIGMGGCSSVYKGCLWDGKHVAVKVMKSSKEVWKDFALEIDISSSLNHKHITTLIGLCIKDNFLIAVYDFLSKGNLEENLHDNKDKSVLSWEVRFNVAVGVAEALNYLHKDCARPVIHRDVKSSNILLSDGLEPQLSDFGLAIWAPTTSPHVTHSDVVGTFGYHAPEYFMYGKVSDKIDVYSYGVVLLELISGRKPIITESPKGKESLVMWAKPLLESGDLNGLLDPNLTGKVDEVQMQRMVLAAALCLTRSSSRRPKMNEILKLLRGENDVEDWMNTLKSGPKESDDHNDDDEDEIYPGSSAGLHLGVALLNVDDDTSLSSMEQNSDQSLED
ncbi:receptor-like serine/threonine-protein kinase ALE2 isoform X2 [Telopea speciosissima]|uniref:receptor-like serine/threonine-protein kinase ALE2 isoform X1 n=1 Tax=Telopea speciosissima TaxID=54955 RepID=UPI001CC71BB1|nr:receptor-like serine/threonine-protein kinase ALE2 isoform X1 [Telopea speciosissima]XP_043713601.1 receptor-like serine/threonine-protein kinase ALE2 isoform X1 [Telopea speciosissima]XP_043713602.1 receptor-like serine/threonine-protein kinase ALE2 isoform X2 [Telopea speciosissima]